jgi:serine/threonine-protein kinase mTOR
MEEIIEIKEFEESIENLNRESKGELKNEMLQEYKRRLVLLQDTWADRLNGNPKDIDTW